MIATVHITSLGNDSVGVVLPREMLERLNASEGDSVTVTETPSGWNISLIDPKKQKQLEIAERIMRENRNMLAKLAQ